MIKFVFRWAFRFLILAIVLVVALLLLKDNILKSVAESQIRAQTGMDVKIGRLEVSLTSPGVTVENIVLYNTAEFGGGPFLDIPDLRIEYDTAAAQKQELHLRLVRLNLRELNIVESRQGRTNIVDILARVERTTGASGKTNTSQEVNFTGIDTLNLSVGKIRYLSLAAPRRNQEFNLALNNEIVQNVRSWNDMAGVLFKVLLRAGITIFLDPPPRPAPLAPPPPR